MGIPGVWLGIGSGIFGRGIDELKADRLCSATGYLLRSFGRLSLGLFVAMSCLLALESLGCGMQIGGIDLYTYIKSDRIRIGLRKYHRTIIIFYGQVMNTVCSSVSVFCRRGAIELQLLLMASSRKTDLGQFGKMWYRITTVSSANQTLAKPDGTVAIYPTKHTSRRSKKSTQKY